MRHGKRYGILLPRCSISLTITVCLPCALNQPKEEQIATEPELASAEYSNDRFNDKFVDLPAGDDSTPDHATIESEYTGFPSLAEEKALISNQKPPKMYSSYFEKYLDELRASDNGVDDSRFAKMIRRVERQAAWDRSKGKSNIAAGIYSPS